ncbi:MAG: hypothetical protein KDJ38_02255, partial [Gammaproteobacteria bacterium]|nr:hypothetical protein [Gammaproteobacteria bacterium]
FRTACIIGEFSMFRTACIIGEFSMFRTACIDGKFSMSRTALIIGDREREQSMQIISSFLIFLLHSMHFFMGHAFPAYIPCFVRA